MTIIPRHADTSSHQLTGAGPTPLSTAPPENITISPDQLIMLLLQFSLYT